MCVFIYENLGLMPTHHHIHHLKSMRSFFTWEFKTWTKSVDQLAIETFLYKSFFLVREVLLWDQFRQEKKFLGLPWWLSGKEFVCQCRRHGFSPWSMKIPRATEQLNPCARIMEPMCCNFWSPSTLETMIHKRSLIIWLHLYELSRGNNYIEIESRFEVACGWEGWKEIGVNS